MDDLQKILVVDSGERAPDFALSTQLAEMGFASVTAPFEAADDVLALIRTPAAIVLQVPSTASCDERTRFLDLADRLRASQGKTGTPVIVLGGANGATSSVLQNELGPHVLSRPER